MFRCSGAKAGNTAGGKDMSSVQELIKAVEASGATLRAEPPDLVIGDPDRLPTELLDRLKERKPELLALLQSRRDGLQARLEHLGIRIAIDTKTGEPCLVFSEDEAEACRHVATVYKPFEREWTDDQKRELLASLRYYERLMRQKARQEETSHEIQASREKEQK